MLVAETDCSNWLSLLVETGCDCSSWLCSNWSVLIVETACDQFKLVQLAVLVQTGSCWLLKLLKLAVISSNWLLLVVETGCDQFKLVLADCGNWLKLVRACCWNWLWLVQTGSCSLLKLAVTSSNWFLLIVKLAQTRPNQLLLVVHDKKDGSNWFLLIVEDWLWLVQTGSCWLKLESWLCMSSNWFLLIMKTGCDQFKLVLYWLLKLAVTSSNWFLADCWNWPWLVQTGSCYCWNCLWPVQTCSCCWNWLWLVQTGSCSLLKLAVTSSNWFLLMVETGSNKAKPVVTRCAWQERWFKLVLADYEDWLWLVQTGCCWLFETGSSKAKPVVTGCAQQGMMAGTSSNWFLLIVETGSD